MALLSEMFLYFVLEFYIMFMSNFIMFCFVYPLHVMKLLDYCIVISLLNGISICWDKINKANNKS